MKHKRHATLTQRNAYNSYKRRLYLRHQLELGRIPQPRKPASWLLALFKEFGVEHAIYIPQPWMDKKTLKDIKAERTKIRDQVRDMLPATATRNDVDSAVTKIATKRVMMKFNST